MLKDKEGNKLTWKQYRARWKEGIQAITPLQQTKTNLIGQWIVLIGIVIGLIATFRLKLWWLCIILIGSSIISITSLLGFYQKYFILRDLDKIIMGGQDEQIGTV
jgi:hypothetical protein